MKVKDFIKKLGEFDQDAEVIIAANDDAETYSILRLISKGHFKKIKSIYNEVEFTYAKAYGGNVLVDNAVCLWQ